MTKLRCMLCCLMICTITIDARTVNDIYKRISAQVSLKVPGNHETIPLLFKEPLMIRESIC